jgi:hypothetical protein
MRILATVANYGFCIVIAKNGCIHHLGEGNIDKVLVADQITGKHLFAQRLIDNLYNG